MEDKYVKQDFWIKGELIIIETIPAGEYPNCSEKIVKADVGRYITKLIGNTKLIKKAPRVSVPTIKFNVEEIKN